jgi:hypothetical protein
MKLGKQILKLLIFVFSVALTPSGLKAQDTIGFTPNGISGWR